MPEEVWISSQKSLQRCSRCRMLEGRRARSYPPADALTGLGGCLGYLTKARENTSVSLTMAEARLTWVQQKLQTYCAAPNCGGRAAAPGQGHWNRTIHVICSLSPSLFLFSKFIPSALFISSQVNNLNDQTSTSQRGQTLLPRETSGWQELSSPLSTQTTKKRSKTAEKKRGCSLQELIEMGNTRCCGSYFSGYERNVCSPNEINRSWEMCAVLLRTMFWLLQKQLEGWMKIAAVNREMLFTEETAVSKAESKIWRLKT